MAADGVGTDQTQGNTAMALQWIKSNWTILASVVGVGIYLVQTDTSNKAEFKSLAADIQSIKTTAADRAQVADGFYGKFSELNLPNRVNNLEKQMGDVMRMLERNQDLQAQANDAIRKDIAGLSLQVGVVSSKVDDLRSVPQIPRKTNLLSPYPIVR